MFLGRQVVSSDALMLVGLSDEVSLETWVPNDILEGERASDTVSGLLKGFDAVLFPILYIGIMLNLSVILQ